MTIYVAGPISGFARLNRPAFTEATKKIRQLGYEARNPHEFCKDIPADSPENVFYRRGVRELTECTDILMLPGWKFSTGANIEYKVAQSLGIRIHEDWDDLEQTILKLRDSQAAQGKEVVR